MAFTVDFQLWPKQSGKKENSFIHSTTLLLIARKYLWIIFFEPTQLWKTKHRISFINFSCLKSINNLNNFPIIIFETVSCCIKTGVKRIRRIGFKMESFWYLIFMSKIYIIKNKTNIFYITRICSNNKWWIKPLSLSFTVKLILSYTYTGRMGISNSLYFRVHSILFTLLM